ncbi:MAG TPA: hypothetical protein DCY26_08535 [Hyphomonas sp.]|nr:hypothetical protein [Hyphomonas sp.]
MMMPHPESDPRLTADIEGYVSGEEDASSPERLCAVTRERLPQDAMVRFVLSPDGVVTPDIACRLPGRGVWVTAKREHVETAAKKGAFARGFKTAVTVPEGLADLIETLLVKRCVDLLGFARKAGQAVTGIDQVRDALRRGVGIEIAEPEFEEVNILDEEEVPRDRQPLGEGPVLGPQQGIAQQTAIDLDLQLEVMENLLAQIDDGDISLRIGNEVILNRHNL